jgi:OmcA/MtrC family decaheme c-type cytochrome
LNCNACHVNNSYKSDQGTLGTVVMKGITTAGTNSTSAVLEADPAKWLVISPKAASCTACHDSSVAIAHVTAFGGAAFGDKSQGVVAGLTGYTAAPRETCSDCHSSGSFKGVDVVHGQQ